MKPTLAARLTTCCALCLCLAAAVPGFAQDEGWVVPDDYEPPADAPSMPPPPLALFGPINFDEVEFPIGTDMSAFSTATLNGAPLPGTLDFSSPSMDITVGVGPGALALVQAPLIRSRDIGTTLTIDFGVDVSRVMFNWAINCGAPDTGEVNVATFDDGGGFVAGTQVMGADMGFFFLENQVDFTPGAGFRSMDVTFSTSPACNRFAIDALSYNDAVPAPAMPAAWLAALAALLLGLGAWLARRRAV